MDTNLAAPASDPRWRFSLKHLLVALGLVCLLLAPFHYFGGIYLFSISFSLALILTCVLVYRATAVGSVVVSFVGLFFGFGLAMVFLTFGVHAFFNCLACMVLAIARVRTKTFAVGLCLTMFAVYGFAISSGFDEMRELSALKMRFPFESLSDRLAFEDESPSAKPSTDQPIHLVSAVANNLDEQDKRLDSRYRYASRTWALQQLHEHTAEQFSRAAGFGLMRMPSVRWELFRFEPRTPIRLPAPVAFASPQPADSTLQSLHNSTFINYIDPERTPYIRSRDEVAGFEPHLLSSIESEGPQPKRDADWQVVRLELVSLQRHAEPRVYIAESLPAMDKLADVPNRPLNAFEQSALPQLATQQDVVVSQQPDRIEMLGALRAGSTCLECHHGDRGKLLGAFSYSLTPLPAAEAAAEKKSEVN
jgi:hypothetical protein